MYCSILTAVWSTITLGLSACCMYNRDANNADNEAGASDSDVVVLDADEREAGPSTANGNATSSKGSAAPALVREHDALVQLSSL